MIKLTLKGQTAPTLYSTASFEELMGIRYLSHLAFKNPRTERKIRSLCEKADKKKHLEQKQKWLGFYYGKEIEDPPPLDLTICWIKDPIGYGVITNTPILKQTCIGEYLGVVRKKSFFGRLKNRYCFDYTIILGEEPRYVIDALDSGNYTRYINHHTKGNLETVSVFAGGIMHILLYATENIPAGTELVYDYGDDYWEKRKKPIL